VFVSFFSEFEQERGRERIGLTAWYDEHASCSYDVLRLVNHSDYGALDDVKNLREKSSEYDGA
jgi:hypothetical protein